MGLIYQQKVTISFDMSDMNGQIKLPQLLQLALQVSTQQSVSLGISDQDLLERYQLVWIITEYEIEMTRLPQFNEEVLIETEALSYNRLFCYRRFSFYDSSGNSLVEIIATFVLMDRESRKVQAVNPEIVAPYQSSFSKKIIRGPKYLPLTPEISQEYQVRFYDLDLNGHVNNSKYVEWMLEALGVDFLSHHTPKKIHLKYIKEVQAESSITSQMIQEGKVSQHQIVTDGTLHAQAVIHWEELGENNGV